MMQQHIDYFHSDKVKASTSYNCYKCRALLPNGKKLHIHERFCDGHAVPLTEEGLWECRVCLQKFRPEFRDGHLISSHKNMGKQYTYFYGKFLN